MTERLLYLKWFVTLLALCLSCAAARSQPIEQPAPASNPEETITDVQCMMIKLHPGPYESWVLSLCRQMTSSKGAKRVSFVDLTSVGKSPAKFAVEYKLSDANEVFIYFRDLEACYAVELQSRECYMVTMEKYASIPAPPKSLQVIDNYMTEGGVRMPSQLEDEYRDER